MASILFAMSGFVKDLVHEFVCPPQSIDEFVLRPPQRSRGPAQETEFAAGSARECSTWHLQHGIFDVDFFKVGIFGRSQQGYHTPHGEPPPGSLA